MIICRCNEVTVAEVKKTLKKNPSLTLKEIKNITGASTNCGKCSLLLKKTYEKLQNELPKGDQLSISF